MWHRTLEDALRLPHEEGEQYEYKVINLRRLTQVGQERPPGSCLSGLFCGQNNRGRRAQREDRMPEEEEAMAADPAAKLREVRIKVFLDREGTPSLPSIYGLFRGADWQERETFDMYGIQFEGHPHPKRLLMPEDWKGWPLRKDYVQPDFYEMQDAY